jgi:cytochrome c oxidase subunit 1
MSHAADTAAPAASGSGATGWTLYGVVATVDHKRIGMLYVCAALGFLVVGGVEAAAMRWQLVRPENSFLAPDVYNRLFTMHGTTMIFFVAMPFLLGIANYLIPLQIGARDMAFPRLNAFGFWSFFFGGLVLYWSYVGGSGLAGAGTAPDAGWFAYAPLSGSAFSRGSSIDYWIIALLISGVGTLAAAVNLMVTILCMRCPGMTLGRMPIFAWMVLVDAFLILIAFPPLSAAQIMLLFDRKLGAHFFDPSYGGSALLWQHLFWFFGHPEVYILILPAFGFVSEILPVFSRKVLFGYPAMVAATLAIGFISFGVWAHHMFSTGLENSALTFFAGASYVIAVPTGIKIFNWIGTLYGGRIAFRAPMLFCVAFLLQFLAGGLTGIMLASAPFDWQLTDSYFIVAHFHYVLGGGMLFAVFAALYYWYPKATGRMLNESLARWHFWLFVLGFNLTFAPMHISGILGMPRRVYTYPAGMGWELWNAVATFGVLVQGIAMAVFLWNLVRSLRRGISAGADPWDGWTLEWSTSSPPPAYNFAEPPVVRSRRPLWDRKHPEDPDWSYE